MDPLAPISASAASMVTLNLAQLGYAAGTAAQAPGAASAVALSRAGTTVRLACDPVP
jgi:hypothetical protein